MEKSRKEKWKNFISIHKYEEVNNSKIVVENDNNI